MNTRETSRTGLVVLGCMHATGGAATREVLSVPCAGSLGLDMLLMPLAQGASGVLVLSCAPDECRHRRCGDVDETPCQASGAEKVAAMRRVLAWAGLSPKRAAHRIVRAGESPSSLIDAFRRDLASIEGWTKETEETTGTSGSALLTTVTSFEPFSGDRCARLFAAVQALVGPSTGRGAAAERGDLLWTGCSELRALASGDGGAPADAAEQLWSRAQRSGRAVIRGRCCGQPLLAVGELGAFKAVARANIELLATAGARRVIVGCAHCAATMTKDWVEAGTPFDFEVIDFATWAGENDGIAAEIGSVARVDPPPELASSDRADPDVMLFAGAPLVRLTWPLAASDPEASGAARREALEGLLDEASRRGARALVVPSSHHAAQWRLITGVGSWQRATDLPILDVAQALLTLSR